VTSGTCNNTTTLEGFLVQLLASTSPAAPGPRSRSVYHWSDKKESNATTQTQALVKAQGQAILHITGP
jgi:hypothetical protein